MLAAPNLYSQNFDKPFKIALNIGPSIPVGNFGSSNIDSSGKQGVAKIGPAATLSVSYRFKNSFLSVIILAGWQQNNVSNTTLSRSLSKFYPTGTHVNVKSDNWHIWKYLAGPEIETPLANSKKISLEFGLLAGILKTTIPGYQVGIISPNLNQAYFAAAIPMSVPVAFCYQASAGMNFRLTRSLTFNGNLNFMHATPKKSYISHLDPPYYYFQIDGVQSYPISALNLMLGLAFSF